MSYKSNDKEIKSNKLYVVYIDILRILATFTVIIFHINTIKGREGSFDFVVGNIYALLENWCVPVFFMISGACFLDDNKRIEIKNMYFKYIKKIVICLLIWGIIYNVIVSVLINKTFAIQYLSQGIINILKGHLPYCYQLWYLYPLIGLYMATPILRIVTKNSTKKEFQYYLIICSIVSIVYPYITEVIIGSMEYEKWTQSLCFFSGYLVYYLLGHYINKYGISNKTMKILIAIIIPYFIVVYLDLINKIEIFGDRELFGYTTPYTFILSCLIFNLCKLFFSKQYKEKTIKIIKFISKHTFGIYILHVMVITGMKKCFSIDVTIAPFIISIPLLSIVVFSISLLLSMIFKKLPLVKNII